MISLVETGIMNALLAILLALPVLILGRIWHRPALVHAFWILVLVKLISPPLFQVSLPWQMPTWSATESATAPLQTVATAGADALFTATAPPALLPESPSAWSSILVYVVLVVWYWSAIGFRLLQAIAIPALAIWFVGSACWFAWQGWRVVRFAQVFLRSAQLAPDSIQDQAQALAQQMGMRFAPDVWLLPAVVSPMLWSVGGRSRILFPSELLYRLDECAVATLLTHELAHYRRGDHQVRMLEFLASGIFWWHPLIWIARREMEISEEQCCDAWVVSQFPASQRRYADALLATVDFLSEDHQPLPAMASGLGDVPMLRQRLKLIMCGTAPKSLSLLGRLAVILTAMLIPFSPSLRTGSVTAMAVPQSATMIATFAPSRTIPKRNLETVRARAAQLKEQIDALTQAVRALQAQRTLAEPPFAIELPGNESAAIIPAAHTNQIRLLPASQELILVCEQSEPAAADAHNSPIQSAVMAWIATVDSETVTAAKHRRDHLTIYRISQALRPTDTQAFWSTCRASISKVWDASKNRLLSLLNAHSSSVHAIALAARGSYLTTADSPRVAPVGKLNVKSSNKIRVTIRSAVL